MIENLSRLYYNRGLALARNNCLDEALANLIKAIGYDRKYIPAWNLAGLCYYRTGNFKTAAICWNQSVKRTQNDNAASYYLADLRSALEKTDLSFNRLNQLCKTRQYRQAGTVLIKDIIPHFDASEKLLSMLGIISLLCYKPLVAAKHWKRALEINQNSATALRYIDEINRRPGYRIILAINKLFNFKKDGTSN